MKKASCLKPSEAQKQRRMTLKVTKSENDIVKIPQRKASTPTHDRTAHPASPDISCILKNDTKLDVLKTGSFEKDTTTKKLYKKPASAKKADLQRTLDIEYNRYIQSVLKTKLKEAQASEVDNELANLQKRIEKNQLVLQETTQRLKNINFNKEIDLLHSLNNPDYGKELEVLNSSNQEEYLAKLHEKLEKSSSQLKVKNIEMPSGGAAELLQLVTDTSEILEKVKRDNNKEAWNVVKKTEEINRKTSNTISRCKESILEVEGLLSTRSRIKISSLNET